MTVKQGISILVFSLMFLPCFPSLAASQTTYKLSKIIIYDVRGMDRKETAIIVEQNGHHVKVWYKNYLGQRTGTMPLAEYEKAFAAMKQIKRFALRKKHRGRPLRRNAAKGSITLAWKDEDGKQIRTIKYFAPENTLDDFRNAFNSIWGLARYAILSKSSISSPKLEYREDAVYFLSGAGWFTRKELLSTVQYHASQKNSSKIAREIWRALYQRYPKSSEFRNKKYLNYCIKKCMHHLGDPAIHYLNTNLNRFSKSKRKLAEEIVSTYKQ